jgi:hypothetical protein
MNDPTNQLPTDPEWLRKADAHVQAAAKDLGCMVVLIAVQEHGKTCMTIDGVPSSGPMAELAQDVPSLIYGVLSACIIQDKAGKAGPQQ